MAPRKWTDEDNDFVLGLLAEGFTANAISRAMTGRLGVEITRNAICGLLWRLRKPPSERATKTPRKPQPPRLAIVHKPRGDVGEGCRYMYGEPVERNFCGAPNVAINSSWCEFHRRIVFN